MQAVFSCIAKHKVTNARLPPIFHGEPCLFICNWLRPRSAFMMSGLQCPNKLCMLQHSALLISTGQAKENSVAPVTHLRKFMPGKLGVPLAQMDICSKRIPSRYVVTCLLSHLFISALWLDKTYFPSPDQDTVLLHLNSALLQNFASRHCGHAVCI